jgi:rhodanese-related sulfurtransferase
MKTAAALVAAADAEIETIAAEDAKVLLGRDDVTFVDVRDIRELQREGRIPGAVHAPRGMIEFWVDPQSPYHREVFASGNRLVFYCSLGWRSALTTKTVKDMGLENVAHIGGGFTAWVEAGGPVEPLPEKKV